MRQMSEIAFISIHLALCLDANTHFLVLYKESMLRKRQIGSIKLVPWGNAYRDGHDKIHCQHGPTECDGTSK